MATFMFSRHLMTPIEYEKLGLPFLYVYLLCRLCIVLLISEATEPIVLKFYAFQQYRVDDKTLTKICLLISTKNLNNVASEFCMVNVVLILQNNIFC